MAQRIKRYYSYAWYEDLKGAIAPLPQDSEIRVFLKDYMSIVLEEMRANSKESGYKFCPDCGHPLNPEDGRCYNSACESYDPLSQY